MLLIIIGLSIIAAAAWYIFSLHRDISVDQSSVNAIDNVSHWFSSQLGHQWPFVMTIIVGLLIVILILSGGCSITINENVWWVIGVLTVVALALATQRWRTEYLSQNYRELGISKKQYYFELGLIVCLLLMNIVVIWLKI